MLELCTTLSLGREDSKSSREARGDGESPLIIHGESRGKRDALPSGVVLVVLIRAEVRIEFSCLAVQVTPPIKPSFLSVGDPTVADLVALGVALIPRRSNELRGRAASFWGGFALALARSRCFVRDSSNGRPFTCLPSPEFVVYGEIAEGLQFSAAEESGSVDLGLVMALWCDTAVLDCACS